MADQDWLKILNYMNTGVQSMQQGMEARQQGAFTSYQLQNNATDTLLAGKRAAGEYALKRDTLASDATVAMVAQGGVVDQDMIAKLKSQVDLDAVGAMYDAKATASSQQFQADTARIQGKRAYRASQVRLGMNLLGAAATYKWKGSAPKMGPDKGWGDM